MPRTQSAAEAADLVLARAGASLHRDAVDLRLIENVRTHKGKVIDSQQEVGGWPVLGSAPAPADSDHDGMSDAWEKAHGLNPNDPSDRNGDRDGDGYTNLEKYLNSVEIHPRPQVHRVHRDLLEAQCFPLRQLCAPSEIIFQLTVVFIPWVAAARTRLEMISRIRLSMTQ